MRKIKIKNPSDKDSAIKDLLSLKSYSPFGYWYAVEIDGKWGCYNGGDKVLRALSKAQHSVGDEILAAQKDNPAYLKKLGKRLTETAQRLKNPTPTAIECVNCGSYLVKSMLKPSCPKCGSTDIIPLENNPHKWYVVERGNADNRSMFKNEQAAQSAMERLNRSAGFEKFWVVSIGNDEVERYNPTKNQTNHISNFSAVVQQYKRLREKGQTPQEAKTWIKRNWGQSGYLDNDDLHEIAKEGEWLRSAYYRESKR